MSPSAREPNHADGPAPIAMPSGKNPLGSSIRSWKGSAVVASGAAAAGASAVRPIEATAPIRAVRSIDASRGRALGDYITVGTSRSRLEMPVRAYSYESHRSRLDGRSRCDSGRTLVTESSITCPVPGGALPGYRRIVRAAQRCDDARAWADCHLSGEVESMRRLASILAVVALPVGFLSAVPQAAATVNSAAPEVCDADPVNPPLPLPEPKVHPIQVTGPPNERLNLIIMGDGYQYDQQSLFFGDVDRNLAVMWSTEPFRTYRNYINVYAVEIPSIDYGVRRDPDGRCRNPDGTIRDTGVREGPIDAKNTALRLWYSDGLTNPLARGTTYGPAPLNCADYAEYYPAGVNPCETGNQAHNRILDNYVEPVLGMDATPANGVQTLAIFNTFTYGGIGGTQATTSGGSPQGPLISLHEIGHSLGTMADEYPYSSRDVVAPCYTGAEPGGNSGFHHTLYTDEQKMIQDQFKWWRWIGEESLSGGKIGLYEGGLGRVPCGIRRPSEHSMMRWIGFDLDQVGREHMVARITGLRNKGQMPLDSNSTSEGTVPQDSVLWVDPTHPRFHELNVTWRVDGQVVETDDSHSLDLGELDLAPGTVVSAVASDPVWREGIIWVRIALTNKLTKDSGSEWLAFVE